jgi:hypothetical protein
MTYPAPRLTAGRIAGALFAIAAPAAAEDAASATPATAPAPAPAPAESRIDALETQVKALTGKLRQLQDNAVTTDDVQGVSNSLESFKAQYARDRNTTTAQSTRNLTLNGLVQVRFVDDSRATNVLNATGGGSTAVPTATSNPPWTENRKSTFDIGTAQFGFSGLLYQDYAEGRNLSFNLKFGTSPQTGTNNNFANLLDANVVYSPVATASPDTPALTFTLGQQTLPFGLEVNTSDALRPVINNAQFVGPSLLGRREIGLIARGDWGITYDYGYNYRSPLSSYAIGIVNGDGPNRADDNNFKDVIARIDFKLPTGYDSWLRELRLGFSAYYGEQNLIGGAGTAASPNFTRGRGAKDRYGIDLYYNHNPIGFTYEYVRVIDDTVTGATPAASRVYRRAGNSHTATLFYNFGNQFLLPNQGRWDDYWPKTWQPFLRYDHWDPDHQVARNETDIWTAGLNVFFAQTTKAQINVNYRIDHQPFGYALHTTEAIGQLQYGF